jgi:hypothetical protein
VGWTDRMGSESEVAGVQQGKLEEDRRRYKRAIESEECESPKEGWEQMEKDTGVE